MKTKLFLLLSAVLMWCSAAFAQDEEVVPPLTEPVAGTEYFIVHSSGMYLSYDGGKFKVMNAGAVTAQRFLLEAVDGAEGNIYNIKLVEGGQYMAGDKPDGWTLTLVDDPADNTLAQFLIENSHDPKYIYIHCTGISGTSNLIGTDDNNVGSTVFSNKSSGDGKRCWLLEEAGEDVINTDNLENAIKTAEETLAGATIGEEPGQYPQTAADALQDAIDTAKAVLENPESQAAVNDAVNTLNAAIVAFNEAVNPDGGSYLDGENKVLSSKTDLHLSDTNPLRNGATVDLQSPDAWLYFDNVKPSIAIDKYLSAVTVNGEAIEPGVNARVNIYLQGTVIIPQAEDYVALEAWTGENYAGEKAEYVVGAAYQDLGEFDNAIKSIKLKRGYMATLANETDGCGYSKVFIADNEDIEIPVLQNELNGKVSYIRCFRWQWVSKKGWCSSGSGWFNELGLTNSTWYYSWSADKYTTEDSEYALIKQNKGWPDFPVINPKEDVTHLLGYNEPDRPEQANASVQTAIDQWPKMMESGLRLGTPAIADNLNWLYEFLDEAKKRNYRVDYVAVHAYWGGPGGAQNVVDGQGNVSIEKWKQKLEDIHNRTGLPIWITEWNNGANWTHGNEPWPGDSAGNAQKARADLEKIIKLFDETPWIERYSIYNWVGDETAIVIGQSDSDNDGIMDNNGKYTAGGPYNQKLSYAGEFYAKNNAPMAYNSEYAVEPTWAVIAPIMSATFDPNTECVNVSWTDYLGELTDECYVERKTDDGEWEVVAKVPASYKNSYSDATVAPFKESHSYTYRIRIKSGEEEAVSDEATVDIPVLSGTGDIRVSNVALSDMEWKSVYFDGNAPFAEEPAVVFGNFNSNSRSLLTYGLQSISTTGFRFKVDPWAYQNVTSLPRAEDGSFVAAKMGHYNWGDLEVEAGTNRGTNTRWVSVTFEKPFAEVPVVFVSPSGITSGCPIYARVRNITKEGFEVHYTAESANSDITLSRMTLSYFAIVPGTTTLSDGSIVEVGKTAETVGELSKKGEITFASAFNEAPMFLCGLQTSNDDYTVNMRYSDLTNTGVTVLKQREKSNGQSVTVATDAVGWMAVSKAFGSVQGVENGLSDNFRVYPTITDGTLNVVAEEGTELYVYNINGLMVKQETYAGQSLDVSDLAAGIYFLRNSAGEVARFIVK